MYLTVLGQNGPFPCAEGSCSGYLLESDSGKTRLVLDLGSGSLARLLKHIKPNEISAVVLSHLHFDHISDVLPLKYAADFSGAGKLKLLCPKTPENVFGLLNNLYDTFDMEACSIGEMRLRFVRVKHPVETYAVRVECDGRAFVYTGDSNECIELTEIADGADLLLADAGLSEQDWTAAKPHLTPVKCAELAKAAGAGRLMLTHLSPLYNYTDLLEDARSVFSNTQLAQTDIRTRI